MKQSKEQLIDLLERTARALREDDSFEGRISFTCMTDIVDLGKDEFEVDAFVRVGNSLGQGGAICIPPTQQIAEESVLGSNLPGSGSESSSGLS
jgi:hypothetical protein